MQKNQKNGTPMTQNFKVVARFIREVVLESKVNKVEKSKSEKKIYLHIYIVAETIVISSGEDRGRFNMFHQLKILGI